MKIQNTPLFVACAFMLQGLVFVAAAQEASKQPPLELPKNIVLSDAPNAAVAPAPKDPPKATPVKKPKVMVAQSAAAQETPVTTETMGQTGIGTYKVKPGDTIDRVIQKFYVNSPLRNEVLRNALVQGNPKAFVKANPKSLLAGAVLVLPDQAELVKKLMPALAPAAPDLSPQNPASSMVATATPVPAPSMPAPSGGAAAHNAGHNPGSEINKRHWVRFP